MENAAETVGIAGLELLTAHEAHLLQETRRICDTVIEPRAEAVDNGVADPLDNLKALAEVGLIGVTTPREWGGQGCSGAFLRVFTETLTAACGTTWFILTQHLGTCGTIFGSENTTLRERFLRDMASGEHFVGVGFGHLRRKEPMLLATVVDGGYRVSGVAPWVTGYPYLSGVVFGATLDTDPERHVYLYAPVIENEQFASSPPLPLCAMNATATTEVTLSNLFVPQENFVKWGSRDAMKRGDDAGIAGAVSPAIGCATGALRDLRRVADKRGAGIPALPAATEAFARELADVRERAYAIADGAKDAPDYKTNALAVRAGAIELAVRIAHAAVAGAGGEGNGRSHPAQRRFREALFYTLTAQTGDILGATVSLLSRETKRND